MCYNKDNKLSYYLGVIFTKQEHIEFFDILTKNVRLTIQILVPNKYKKLDTELLACVCYQQLLLKKIVVDNMKECADKYANSVCKTNSLDEKNITELEDIELDSDMENLIENYLYFKRRYRDKVNSDIITAYISYMLVNTEKYKSKSFFTNCMYKNNNNLKKVNDELLSIINVCIENPIPSELFQYGKLLTSQLYYTHYDCFGRDKEIKQCVNILSQMKKNNVILVGEAGVGKTTVVSGICNYLQSDKCPNNLKDLCIFELNINKLISGTTYRGDLEKRLDQLIDMLSKSNVIVFIDEMHMLFSKAGGEGDTSVIQNVLKPFLSENSRVIGCTTNNEYKVIEKDKAFERRFSIVQVPELSIDDTYELLLNSKSSYEDYHNISVSESDCRYIVDMCNTYIKNRNFPDKAFDVLDKTCVLSSLDGYSNVRIQDIDKSIYDISSIDPSNKTIKDISLIEDKLKNRIVGQDHAISKICKCLKKFYSGTNNKNKPIGCYLFVGSTGVGKTDLCRQLSKLCFTDESFIRFDMSEFMESNSVSKLIGASPGYVGYSSGGALTEKVKHNPFSIILFDEIEKAHIDVINILLQIMDDGRLTDSFGNSVNFCNCLIIMTSNIGCREITDKSSIGFCNDNTTQTLQKSINDYFSPEFRNRLDDIIIFNQISEEMYSKIFELKLNDYFNLYESKIEIQISDIAKDKLYKDCYSKKDGVRYIHNKICDNLDDIILNSIDEYESIFIDVCENNYIIKESGFEVEKQH
jgi:ATP-dependent Clp protease ATP-binding subunit ClpA